MVSARLRPSGLLLGPAEGRLGLRVPGGDAARGIHRHERIVRRVDDPAEVALGLAQRLLGALALGDVGGDCAHRVRPPVESSSGNFADR